MTLTVVDGLIIGLYLIVVIAIGVAELGARLFARPGPDRG